MVQLLDRDDERASFGSRIYLPLQHPRPGGIANWSRTGGVLSGTPIGTEVIPSPPSSRAMGDAGCSRLAQAIIQRRAGHAKALVLRNNDIGDVGATQLALALTRKKEQQPCVK